MQFRQLVLKKLKDGTAKTLGWPPWTWRTNQWIGKPACRIPHEEEEPEWTAKPFPRAVGGSRHPTLISHALTACALREKLTGPTPELAAVSDERGVDSQWQTVKARDQRHSKARCLLQEAGFWATRQHNPFSSSWFSWICLPKQDANASYGYGKYGTL